ncbi:AAA family ATPase [Sagittula salina]|uniref:AAA family ATPase n=1 Tax=Sagittula salina TaxID=2820268 RepID=A0A940S0E3_9RHOB|nr:AAA family ATPase [Sagittula salina]
MRGLIVLSGLPGVGKSTVAEVLCDETGALWLRADAIEQAMRESHMDCADLADGGYAAMRVVAGEALSRGLPVVIDCVNPLAVTRQPWKTLAPASGGLCVELFCSDAAEHRRRVEMRHTDIAGFALPDWAAVQARVWEPWDGALRLDTMRPVGETVAEILKKAGEG